MRDRLKIKGMVTVRVLDKDGKAKRRPPSWFTRLLGLQGRLMVSRHHNIVTIEGDAMIADALLPSPAKTKVTSASGFLQVGTGWTGNSTKQNSRCNTSSGGMIALDSGYPVIKDPSSPADNATLVYRATFAAGTLNANGINEACLLNGNGPSALCLAYAQITPSVNVTSSDTLQVTWEISILGQ